MFDPVDPWMTFRTRLTPEQAEEINRRYMEVAVPGFAGLAKKLPLRPHEVENSSAYIAMWAKALRMACPTEILKDLAADYWTIARNPQVNAEFRERAQRRAQALTDPA